jgi:hypothetical protein
MGWPPGGKGAGAERAQSASLSLVVPTSVQCADESETRETDAMSRSLEFILIDAVRILRGISQGLEGDMNR